VWAFRAFLFSSLGHPNYPQADTQPSCAFQAFRILSVKHLSHTNGDSSPWRGVPNRRDHGGGENCSRAGCGGCCGPAGCSSPRRRARVSRRAPRHLKEHPRRPPHTKRHLSSRDVRGKCRYGLNSSPHGAPARPRAPQVHHLEVGTKPPRFHPYILGVFTPQRFLFLVTCWHAPPTGTSRQITPPRLHVPGDRGAPLSLPPAPPPGGN
jgi:hypothetical protein